MPPIQERLATLEARQDGMANQIDKLDRCVNGTADTPGLITRIDRLEQSRLSLMQQIALYLAAIGAIAALFQAVWSR